MNVIKSISSQFWLTFSYTVVVIPVAIASAIVATFSEIYGEAIGRDHPGFLLPGTGEIEFFISSALFSIILFLGMNITLLHSWKQSFRLIDHFQLCGALYAIVLTMTNGLLTDLESYRHNLYLGATLVPAWIGICSNFFYMMYFNNKFTK